ncbi:MAG: hypothetical protein U0893_09125 [Chloroflexota bacterium]
MSQPPSDARYDEVAVLFTPDETGATGGSADGQARPYTVLIYTGVAGPWGTEPVTPPAGRPGRVGGLPLVAVEHMTIRWSRYRDLPRTVDELAELGTALRGRFIHLVSPALQALLEGEADFSRPVRIWWHSDVPELIELPWELFAASAMARSPIQFHVVRGLPGESLPPVPLDGNRLRLALIGTPGPATELIQTALQRIRHLRVEVMDGSTRESLSRAAADGFELVHLVADGSVSPAFEGILIPRDTLESRLMARDLSRLLRGSRVTVLGLTELSREAPSPPRPAVKRAPHAVAEVLSPYRAFTHLGAAPEALPSIVAPLGYLDDDAVSRFWRTFYRTLAETLSIEEAQRKAHTASTTVPMALFLRHRLGQQFLASAPEEVKQLEPNRLSADLQVNRSLAERLQLIDASFGDLDDSISGSELFTRESSRQSHLEDVLQNWEGGREDVEA